jgi:DNA-binding CsgD family transcriptional regulator
VRDQGSVTEAPQPASDWILVADTAFVAFLRLLGDNPDPQTVTEALARGPLAAFRPAVSVLAFVLPEREALFVVGLVGCEGEALRRLTTIPLAADIPATRCYRTNQVISVPSAQLVEDFPLVAPYVMAAPPATDGEAIVFPIRSRGGVIAVLGLDFPQRVTQPWLLRAAVASLSGPLALWTALQLQASDGDGAGSERRGGRSLSITERQHRIIELVRQGCTNRQIAEEIGFSVPTVKAELANLCTLLGAGNRSELAARAARAGL